MELVVISETAYPVHPLGIDDPVWVHDFKVLPSVREMTDLEKLEDSVRECFRKVCNRDLKKDRFTALIL